MAVLEFENHLLDPRRDNLGGQCLINITLGSAVNLSLVFKNRSLAVAIVTAKSGNIGRHQLLKKSTSPPLVHLTFHNPTGNIEEDKVEGKSQSPPVVAPPGIPGVANRISRRNRNAYALEYNELKFLSHHY